MKYQKKPVVIEAFQMTEERRQGGGWPGWLLKAWQMLPGNEGALWSGRNYLWVGATGGSVKVLYDDWIIRGVKGELYPCKPDIFEETYGEMEDTEVKEFDKELFIFALETKIKGLQKLLQTESTVRLRRAIAILDERDRQDDLWGEQNHLLPEWMVILTKQIGELAAAVLNRGRIKQDWRKEAIQVAAVALAMLEQYHGEE